MPIKYLVLDSGVVSKLCNPNGEQSGPVEQCLVRSIARFGGDLEIILPAVVLYEVRRGFLRGVDINKIRQESLERLDSIGTVHGVEPLGRDIAETGARFWADARQKGKPTSQTASDDKLDCDVLVAAYAAVLNGDLLTENVKHMVRYVGSSFHWEQYPPDY